MFIKTIHIDAFGGVRDLTLDLSQGLNIIEGVNESGKSSVATFIKFVLYGLSGRSGAGAVSERRKYVNWETGSAQGYIILCKGERTYKVSRELYVSSSDGENEAVRERCSVTDAETGEKLFSGEVPGMALLNMPEQMFFNTVFVRQIGGISIDGTGMNEAIENILYSGNEQISTRRAIEKLDKSRKNLMHKNGNGGKIFDAVREKMNLESELESSRAKNADIIELEGQLSDSATLIANREAGAAKLTDLIAAQDKLKELEKLARIEDMEEEAARLEKSLADYPTEDETEKAATEMRATAKLRSDIEQRLKTLRMNIANLNLTLPPRMTEEEIDSDRGDARAAINASSKKKSLFIVAIITAVLAVLCGGAALFLRAVDPSLMIVALGAAGVMFIISIVMLVLQLVNISRLNVLLAKWRAQDADDLCNIVEAKIEENAMLHSETSDIYLLTRDEQACASEREAIVAKQRELAIRFADDEPDTDIMTEKAIAKTSEIIRSINAIRAELSAVRGKLSVMGNPSSEKRETIRREAIEASEGPHGEAAANMTTAERAKAERDRGFFLSTAEAQRKRHVELEKRFSLLAANFVPPAIIAAKINELDEEISEMNRSLRAVVLAMDTVSRASDSLRRSLMPRVVSEAGALLGEFTNGAHNQVGLDADFTMSYSPAGYTREADFMSAGTRDAAYISLRSALMRVLFEDDAPPMIYDESFARIDEKRLSKILSMLSQEKGTQSLVFTCRELESTLGRDASHIKL